MSITTKIHANDTKKTVITKLDLKVTDVNDLQWIEFEFKVKRCYFELKISTDYTWTDSKTAETETAIQNAIEQCRKGSDFGLDADNLRELVKWRLMQLHQYARRIREGARGQESESSSSKPAPYDPVRDCK